MAKRTVSQLNHAYGFLPGKPVSGGIMSAEILSKSAAHPRFVTTGDFSDIARNHCCATMVTNFLLQGYVGDDAVRQILPGFRMEDNGCVVINSNRKENLYRENNNMSVRLDAEEAFKEAARKVFLTVHQYVGNGPVLSLRQANRFLRDAGIRGCFQRIRRKALFSILSSGRPAALLVAASPFDWHWILAVGISESSPSASQSAGRKECGVPANPSDHFWDSHHSQPPRTLSLQVINNWESDTLKTYIPSQGAKILAVWIYKKC